MQGMQNKKPAGVAKATTGGAATCGVTGPELRAAALLRTRVQREQGGFVLPDPVLMAAGLTYATPESQLLIDDFLNTSVSRWLLDLEPGSRRLPGSPNCRLVATLRTKPKRQPHAVQVRYQIDGSSVDAVLADLATLRDERCSPLLLVYRDDCPPRAIRKAERAGWEVCTGSTARQRIDRLTKKHLEGWLIQLAACAGTNSSAADRLRQLGEELAMVTSAHGVRNPFLPGAAKEIQIALALGHTNSPSKHGFDAFDKQGRGVEYLTAAGEGNFSIDDMGRSNMHRIERNAAFYFVAFDRDSPLTIQSVWKVPTVRVRDFALSQFEERERRAREAGVALPAKNQLTIPSGWVIEHGRRVPLRTSDA